MTKGNEAFETIRNVESLVLKLMSINNIRFCSLTLLAMSKIHFITSCEVERIYNESSKVGRGGFTYGEKSLNDDSEDFTKNLTRYSLKQETKKIYFLTKCGTEDYKEIETDETRLKLYFDYFHFGKNPDVPLSLLEQSLTKSRYCFASALRETSLLFNSNL